MIYGINRLRPRLLFFVTADWFFCSHFLERAVAVRNAGYDVIVLCNVDRHQEVIESFGLRVIAIPIDRRSLNPFSALTMLARVYQVYKREKPILIHQIALKPILFGSFAARLARVPHILNAVVGGGYISTSNLLLIRFLRPVFEFSLRLFLNPPGSRVVFENSDDLNAFVNAKQVRQEDAVLIRGAGVEPHRYKLALITPDTPIVLMAARLLWDKGIGEFIEAARMLIADQVSARFVIVGDIDPGNRASIDGNTLTAWRDEGIVEFWGFRTDMPEVLAKASIVCLPSYREGLPKALLEAMAAGLPCVTTDVPGCREAVRHEDNGLLVPPRDPQALADALKMLINNSDMQKRMGLRGRERVEAEFSSEMVIKQTLALYKEMLAP